MPEELSSREELEADLDLRLIALWEHMDVFDEETRDMVLRFVRIAYHMGYWDAWTEDRPLSLFIDHDTTAPMRRQS